MDELKNEQQVIEEAVKEIKGADESQIKDIIEKWFESTRTEGMKLGAYYIRAGIYAALQKNLNKDGKPSLNDYRRCIKDIRKIVEIKISTEQNDAEEKVDNEQEGNI